MARRSATIEFLNRLVEWSGSNSSFCLLTGIQQSNLSDYLSGKKSLTWKRLRRCCEQVFGEPPAFIPVCEGKVLNPSILPTGKDLPKEGGLYALFDSSMRIVYYGKATNLYSEVRQTLGRLVREVRPWTGARNLKFRDISSYMSAYRIERGDVSFRHDMEAFGLRLFVNNTFNKNSGSFKRKK